MDMTDTPLRKLSLFALLAALATGASALTIGIAPAEGKAYAPAPEGIGSPISSLVSGGLAVLFDGGHVATDAGPVRVDRSEWGAPWYGLVEARENLVDYVIALYVAWMDSTFHKNVLLAGSIDYRLVRVRDGKVLVEGSLDGPPDSEDASAHEARTASQAGASAADLCLKKLSALAMGGE
jgi:hypothetical protein